MKKFNVTSRVKKTLIATGSALVCVGAVALIVTLNSGATPTPVQAVLSSSMATSTQVSVPDIIVVSQESSASSAFVPSSGASGTSSLTEISKPASAPPKPVISKNSSALTNKSSKPSYSSKPAASSKKSNDTAASSKPSGGKAGQVYDPVFGWTYPTGGSGTVVSGFDDGSGKQVGIMD